MVEGIGEVAKVAGEKSQDQKDMWKEIGAGFAQGAASAAGDVIGGNIQADAVRAESEAKYGRAPWQKQLGANFGGDLQAQLGDNSLVPGQSPESGVRGDFNELTKRIQTMNSLRSFRG